MPTLLDMSVWGQPPPELPGGQPLGEACDPAAHCPPSPLERKWACDSRRLSPRGPVLPHGLRYKPFLGCELGNSKSIRLLTVCRGQNVLRRRVLVTQSCRTLSDPMDHSPPGSSIHGILQARVLEWGAIAFSHFIFFPFITFSPNLFYQM